MARKQLRRADELERVRRRRRRRRIGRIRLGILAAAVAFGVAAALLKVGEVRVTGTKETAPTDVIEASGLTGVERVLAMRLDPIRRRVEAMPGVRSASVRRAFPNVIVVEVVERTAVAKLEGHPGLVVDDEGRIFPDARERPVPVLSGWKGRPRAGDTVDADSGRFLSEFAAFPELLRTGGGRIQMQSAQQPGGAEHGLILALADGTQIWFGRPERLAAKAASAAAVITDARSKGTQLEYVDVRAPSTPVAKARGAPAPAPAPTSTPRPRPRTTPRPAQTGRPSPPP